MKPHPNLHAIARAGCLGESRNDDKDDIFHVKALSGSVALPEGLVTAGTAPELGLARVPHD
jgi:hypothetical protein